MLPEAAEEWPQTAWRIAILMGNVALLSCRGLQIGEYVDLCAGSGGIVLEMGVMSSSV